MSNENKENYDNICDFFKNTFGIEMTDEDAKMLVNFMAIKSNHKHPELREKLVEHITSMQDKLKNGEYAGSLDQDYFKSLDPSLTEGKTVEEFNIETLENLKKILQTYYLNIPNE